MKRYLTAIVLVVGLIMGFWYFYDESSRTVTKAKLADEQSQAQVETLKDQREASTRQIVALNQSVRASVEFLTAWKAYYAANRDYESIINKVAEKSKCAVVGRKWESKRITLGRLDYDVDGFTGMVVGDYRDIVKFIGELESQMQLSTIWTMEFKEGVNEVTCSMTVYFPTFLFGGTAGASLGGNL